MLPVKKSDQLLLNITTSTIYAQKVHAAEKWNQKKKKDASSFVLFDSFCR